MKKYDIFLVNLNPGQGSEQLGIRPCLVVQNNMANQSRLQTVSIVPMTSNIHPTPSGVITFPSTDNGLTQKSRIEISQLRVVDRSRLQKKLGTLDLHYREELNHKIKTFFDLEDRYV